MYVISGRQLVINVEYNQLDPLLRAAGYPEGDVNCETGFSPFPGNINQVKEINGIISFINVNGIIGRNKRGVII